MFDANLVLQASVTKTASFNGAGVAIQGTPHCGLVARVLYSAATNASGSSSFTFTVEGSTTSGGTYYLIASGAKDVVNLSTTAQAGEIFIPFETDFAYVRLVETLAGAGPTPTITYSGDIGLDRP